MVDLRKALGDLDHMLRFDAIDKNPEHSMAWSLRGSVLWVLVNRIEPKHLANHSLITEFWLELTVLQARAVSAGIQAL